MNNKPRKTTRKLTEKQKNKLIAYIKHLYEVDLLSLTSIMEKTGLTRGMVYYFLLKGKVDIFKRGDWERQRRRRKIESPAK